MLLTACNIHFAIRYNLRRRLNAYESRTNCIRLHINGINVTYSEIKPTNRHGCPNTAKNRLRSLIQHVEYEIFLPCFQIAFRQVDVTIFPREILSRQRSNVSRHLSLAFHLRIRYRPRINDKTTLRSSFNRYHHSEAHFTVLYRHLSYRVKSRSIDSP